MTEWQMLTLVGEDQPGIVAQLTKALYQGGYTLGETSMIRLGGNFTIMMMVGGDSPANLLDALVSPVAEKLKLQYHLDSIQGELHQHLAPNYQVRVVGADRAGIIARVTGVLAAHGFNILELESDVIGSKLQPVYLMTIQGFAETTLEKLQDQLHALKDEGIEINISPVETLIG